VIFFAYLECSLLNAAPHLLPLCAHGTGEHMRSNGASAGNNPSQLAACYETVRAVRRRTFGKPKVRRLWAVAAGRLKRCTRVRTGTSRGRMRCPVLRACLCTCAGPGMPEAPPPVVSTPTANVSIPNKPHCHHQREHTKQAALAQRILACVSVRATVVPIAIAANIVWTQTGAKCALPLVNPQSIQPIT
jgi:hypothetical protein